MCVSVCVSRPNLLNYSTETDEIWYVFLSADLNPIKKFCARLFLKILKMKKNYRSIKFKFFFLKVQTNPQIPQRFNFSIILLGEKIIEVYKSSFRFFAKTKIDFFFENLKLIIAKKYRSIKFKICPYT